MGLLYLSLLILFSQIRVLYAFVAALGFLVALGFVFTIVDDFSRYTWVYLLKLKSRDKYSKPTWGLARFHFTYPWFKTLHFAHLNFNPLAFRNPPLRLPSEKHIFRQKQT